MRLAAATARPRRRDAVRNQQLVLDAARDVLAEHGLDASMELIAARAGVGVGTVYRKYPNKDALVDELVRIIVDELVAAATAARDRTAGDGLEGFLRILGRSFVQHRGYAGMLVGHTRAECGAQKLRALIAELTTQAVDTGELAAWVTTGDVMTMIWALRGVVDTSGAAAPSAWERHLDIHLTGLRATQAGSSRRPLTASQLARIGARDA